MNKLIEQNHQLDLHSRKRTGVAQTHQNDADTDENGQIGTGRRNEGDQNATGEQQSDIHVKHDGDGDFQCTDQHVHATPNNVGQADHGDSIRVLSTFDAEVVFQEDRDEIKKLILESD